MSRDVRLYLDDLVEASSRIVEYSTGMAFEDFVSNKMAYDAILRNLEIIGEAAKNVPYEFREQYPLWNGAKWLACGMSLHMGILG